MSGREVADFLPGFFRVLDPYAAPRYFESEELTTVLLALSPRQRRVLREYVEKVELGGLGVVAWLADEKCPVTERSWYKVNGQYKNSPVFQQALEAYLRAAVKAEAAEETRAIAKAKRTLRLNAAAAAERIADQVGSDIGAFFRETDEWTDTPRPTDEILETRKREDKDGNTIAEYRVRRTVLDVDTLRNPKLSRFVRKFEDGPKGLKIELYDALRAAETILDRADMETASKGEVEVSDARERLAQLLRANDGGGAEEAAEGAGPAGAGEPE